MDFVTSVLLVLIIIFILDKYAHSYWSRRDVFQLQPSFLFGSLGGMFSLRRCSGDFFAEIYEKFKGLKFVGGYMFYQPILIVTDPELIQDVLIKNFNSFHDRPFPAGAAKRYPLIDHLFSARGQRWRDLRVKLTPTFTSGKLKAMFPIINDCADVLQKYVEDNVEKSNDIFEFRDLFARFTTNVISSVAFGIENDSINDRDNHFRKMGMKLFETNVRNTIFSLFALLTPDLFVKLGIDPFGKEITEFMYSVVKQTVDYREQNKVERNDFMQLLLKLKNEGYIPVDRDEIGVEYDFEDENKVRKLNMDEITANVFLFFAAGFETSSSLASFCLFELCKNPEKQRKAQSEIENVLKAHDGKLTYASLSDMKYVDCCLDETLRKHPIAPFISRTCNQDYQIPGTNKIIEKGTTIFIPISGVQRDSEIFENPLEFKPERFLNSSNGCGTAKGTFYLPFGDGPRNCIGARMGKLQSKIGLVVLLQKFNFQYVNKSLEKQEIEYHPRQFFLTPKETIFVKVSSIAEHYKETI